MGFGGLLLHSGGGGGRWPFKGRDLSVRGQKVEKTRGCGRGASNLLPYILFYGYFQSIC